MLDAIANESGSGPVLHRAARINALLGHPRKSASLASQALDATAPELPPHLRRQAESLLRESA